MLRVLPQLTSWAAGGIAAIMMFAMFYHTSRFEAYMIGKNIVILVIAVFIAWGRWDGAPIQPRSGR